jgi:hypothetical protein
MTMPAPESNGRSQMTIEQKTKMPPALPFQNKRERRVTCENLPHQRRKWKP